MVYQEGITDRFVVYSALAAVAVYLVINPLANSLLILSALAAIYVLSRNFKVLLCDLSGAELAWIFTVLLYPMSFFYAYLMYGSKIDAETFVEFYRLSFLAVILFLVFRKSEVLTSTNIKIAVALFAGLTGALGVYYWFSQGGVRITVGTPLINMYALLMTVATGLVMLFALSEYRHNYRWCYIFCFCVAGGGVFASGSKSAILALIGVFLALSASTVFRNRHCVKTLLILLSPLILIGFIMNPFSRLETLISNVETYADQPGIEVSEDSSTQQRIQMYRAAISAIQAEPLFGIGTWRLGEIFPELLEQGGLSAATKRYVHVHNELLQAWMTRGLPGLILLLMLFLAPLWGIQHRCSFCKGCISTVLFVYMVFAMFEAPLNATVSYAFFMMLISLLLACKTGAQGINSESFES
ncbi:O-antigen ligase family protein [Amphritea pacifica]|uniref:O-antigen ligase family protein n=1 Tax=Amphritea pacifica TaxID=2811233 RepID=A0ABS2W9J4_9GAMM|nr:O-antigen ligase family protein [Amphritea pacifica]MBN0988373.1 O-antigen ligase family protein [Amphritea pacifica]